MKKFLTLLIFLMITFWASVPWVSAQNLLIQNSQIGKDYRLEKGEVINEDLYVGGESVEINGTVNGDLYVAGRNINIDGQVTGDLLAAGSTVYISGNIGQDARIAGGNIIITGRIGKNASLIGGNINLSDTSVIYGGLGSLFGNLTQSSSIGHYLKGAGGNINISNHIGGNVDLAIGSLSITKNSQILGDLTYWSKDRGSVDKDAHISGRTIFNKTENVPQFGNQNIKKTVNTAFRFGSLVFTYIIGLIFLFLFPTFTQKAVKNIREKTLLSFAIGLLSPLLLVLVCLILIFTLVGIPLSISIFFIYLLLIYFSRIPVIYALGSFLAQKIGSRENTFWTFTFGILLYFILTSVPYINGITKFVTLTLGSGAFFLAFKIQKSALISPSRKSRKQ